MTVDTVFDLASLTKPVATGTAIARLLEVGRIQLDAPVGRYLPPFAAAGGDRARITIRHLLTHAGGLPTGGAYAGKTRTLAQIIGEIAGGRQISPLLVDGQVHGGLTQGIGQALWEEVAYDAEGQLVTGTLMDYAAPKAEFLPMFENDRTETPSPLNPLGAKGIGELATIGSTPAIVNAVVDALSPFGITHLDMPLKPQRVWEAIRNARSMGAAAD